VEFCARIWLWSFSFGCYLTHYSCLRIVAILYLDTEKTHNVCCVKSQRTHLQGSHLFYLRKSVLRYLQDSIKSCDSRTVNVKAIRERLCQNRYAMRKLPNLFPSEHFFFISSFLPSFPFLSKSYWLPSTTLLQYSHMYIGAITHSAQSTDTTVYQHAIHFAFTSAQGMFKTWSWRQIRKSGSKQELLCLWWPRDLNCVPFPPDTSANVTCLQPFVFLRSRHCILSSYTKLRLIRCEFWRKLYGLKLRLLFNKQNMYFLRLEKAEGQDTEHEN
jgi:hypothetical protein